MTSTRASPPSACLAAFVAAGQSLRRRIPLLAQRGIYDEFVDALAARAQAIRLGDPALYRHPDGTTPSAPASGTRSPPWIQSALMRGRHSRPVARSLRCQNLPMLASSSPLPPMSDATMDMTTVAREEISGPRCGEILRRRTRRRAYG